MIKKKICVLGAFAVGKTSLINRYVKSIFSEKYHTTIGVKTDQKDVVINGQEVRLILWDINGEDDYQHIRPSYLTGSSGFLVIIDGTRRNTIETAESIYKLAVNVLGDIPFSVLINKKDLAFEWEITEQDMEDFKKKNWPLYLTSAKSGENVEKAFFELAERIMKQ